ncbi:MAG: NifB/NifX family molybdenum-iron cluster-binding protein [Rhodocyclaceae bacterium]|nr:NifB/NifX family molybdenum-iron cluster-binding protein [Rhodocyclaceae bacterium]
MIDGHFGACRAFLVYQVSPEEVEFVDALSTAAADTAEDRNKARAALIGACQIVCFQSIGGPLAAGLLAPNENVRFLPSRNVRYFVKSACLHGCKRGSAALTTTR